MRVTLHDYITDPNLPQKDGVNIAHQDIKRLLQDNTDTRLKVTFHDFMRLCIDENYAIEILSNTDCVVSNVGPHAHYYFYLRHKLGLDFRIIRDVRTALWSSYLLQEYLCKNYLRKQDTLLVATFYAWGIYDKIFPHLKANKTRRCYPLTYGFPKQLPLRSRPAPRTGETITMGYVGRLSEDKNFPQLVELLIRLNRNHPHKYRLIACGDIHSPSCQPEILEQQIIKALGHNGIFKHIAAREHTGIWEFYHNIDVLIFPSTSNLETLGRVLVEASYCGVPIIAGEHAAAAELLPEQSLCPVKHHANQYFSAHFDHPLGSIDLDVLIEKLQYRDFVESNCYQDFNKHPARFLQILLNEEPDEIISEQVYQLKPSQKQFIDSLEVIFPEYLDLNCSNRLIAKLLKWFVELQRKDSINYEKRLTQLLDISQHKQRTVSYIDKCKITNADFTNVGGVDIELCHVAKFYPRFALAGIDENVSDAGLSSFPVQTLRKSNNLENTSVNTSNDL